jgi:cytochrome c oxidase assembly factor CtaG
MPAVSEWSFEPWVVGPLLLSLAWFGIGAWRLRDRGADAAALGRRTGYFLAGSALLALALMSPIDVAADRSFAAHMLEHELLMLAAAPLLVLSAPVGVALWALPHGVRLALAGAGRAPAWSRCWAALSSLGGATMLQAIALWGWHVPRLFSLALEHEGWHVIQHLSFLATALLFWYAVWRAPRARIGGTVGALFFTATISGSLGALMAFARGPWYADYAALGLTPMGLSPLQDQQLAGLLMWIPGGLVHAGAALWLLGFALRRPAAEAGNAA